MPSRTHMRLQAVAAATPLQGILLLIRNYKLSHPALIFHSTTNILTPAVNSSISFYSSHKFFANPSPLPHIYQTKLLNQPSNAMSAPNAPLTDLAVNSANPAFEPASTAEPSPSVQPMHQGSLGSTLEIQRQLLQQKLSEQ